MLNSIKGIFKKLKDLTITSKEKAAAAFVVSSVATYMSENGLTYKQILTKHGLIALVVGIVVHQATFWTTNSQPVQQ